MPSPKTTNAARAPQGRSKRIEIRTTPEYHAKWLKAAQQAGLSLSAYIEKRVNGETVHPRIEV